MAESEPTPPKPDLAKLWNQWLSDSERQWNTFFSQATGAEGFGERLGRSLDVFLHLQKNMSEAMGMYSMAMNIPTRADVLELGERLLAIENRLAGLEAAIRTQLRTGGRPSEPGEALRPPRTKQPSAD